MNKLVKKPTGVGGSLFGNVSSFQEPPRVVSATFRDIPASKSQQRSAAPQVPTADPKWGDRIAPYLSTIWASFGIFGIVLLMGNILLASASGDLRGSREKFLNNGSGVLPVAAFTLACGYFYFKEGQKHG